MLSMNGTQWSSQIAQGCIGVDATWISAPAWTLHCNHSQTCHLCWRQSAQAQQTQENGYQDPNSRWCNVTGAQIRAAFLCLLKLRERRPWTVVYRSFSRVGWEIKQTNLWQSWNFKIFVKNKKIKLACTFEKPEVNVRYVQGDYFYFTLNLHWLNLIKKKTAVASLFYSLH